MPTTFVRLRPHLLAASARPPPLHPSDPTRLPRRTRQMHRLPTQYQQGMPATPTRTLLLPAHPHPWLEESTPRPYHHHPRTTPNSSTRTRPNSNSAVPSSSPSRMLRRPTRQRRPLRSRRHLAMGSTLSRRLKMADRHQRSNSSSDLASSASSPARLPEAL